LVAALLFGFFLGRSFVDRCPKCQSKELSLAAFFGSVVMFGVFLFQVSRSHPLDVFFAKTISEYSAKPDCLALLGIATVLSVVRVLIGCSCHTCPGKNGFFNDLLMIYGLSIPLTFFISVP
jgi:hypothetical protein